MYTGGRHPKLDVNRAVKPQNSKFLEMFFFLLFLGWPHGIYYGGVALSSNNLFVYTAKNSVP